MSLKENLNELQDREPGYFPCEEIANQLRQVTLAPVIGPSGIGKSTLLDTVQLTNKDFSRALSFTTRSKRDGESKNQYRFLNHDEPTASRILERVRRRELVQYSVHPSTGYIYGSDIDSYRTPFVMIDVLSTGLAPLRQLPVKSIVEVSIVCTPREWERRFASRKVATEDAQKRIKEGVNSLEWSLDQGEDMIWVDNSDKKVEDTASEYIDIVLGKTSPTPTGRAVGEILLKHLRSI